MSLRAMQLSPDGRLIVTGGTGKVVKVWDLITATLLTSAPGRHSGTVSAFVACILFVHDLCEIRLSRLSARR
eukprot:21184-Eustigmatos_ZCMA.PRE.1